METLITAILGSLYTASIGLSILVAAYLSNVAFSLYLNIKIKREMFSWARLVDSFLKILVFVIGVVLLIVAINAVVILMSEYINVSDQTQDIINISAVVAVIGQAAAKYITEAFATFKSILNGKPSENAGALDNKE